MQKIIFEDFEFKLSQRVGVMLRFYGEKIVTVSEIDKLIEMLNAMKDTFPVSEFAIVLADNPEKPELFGEIKK